MITQMTERSENFMKSVWELRNNGADTEEKLVAAILQVAAETVRSYTAQNDLQVLDKNDMLQLAEELQE
jgi:Mn-dependent DtxR family transcriptional regulator